MDDVRIEFMDFVPDLTLGWTNGWVPLLAFYLVFGILLLISPRSVVARLYDRTGWTEPQKAITAFGKIFIFAWFLLVVFSPLKIDTFEFYLGSFLFVIGTTGMVVALINYRSAPIDQPVTGGLYRVSRNPQVLTIFVAFFGISFAIGAWLGLVLLSLAGFFSHIRVLAEEKSCLQQYGDSYMRYMERVPRYFMFF
jgi:protein-S-isoprenylcysteine O-methyltransferase Ste14